MRRWMSLVLVLGLLLCVCSIPVLAADREEIVILYESDVHCAVEGYAVLSAWKQELSLHHDYVGVVTSGDFMQGSSLGAVSRGQYIAELMNMVGYDAIALGNHEFDFTLPALYQVRDLLDTKPVSCNFLEISGEKPVFAPYTMVSYGEVDVAFIGVTTPSTITSARPSQFMATDGQPYLYSFGGSRLYEIVQHAIDAAEAEGADHIIALTHLGTESVNPQWSAQALAANTEGLDVILDGHSHSVVESMELQDAAGESVLLSSTGSRFANIGKLTIGDGVYQTELIPVSGQEKTDPAILKRIEEIEQEYAVLGERKVAQSSVRLAMEEEGGKRLIRNTPTNLGDLCADAYRVVTGADIGLINGGGIRANIEPGPVTFNDLVSVFPFNNTVVTAEATGQQILDFLELAVMSYPEENGTFQHISGLNFDLDPSVPTSVELDENEVFLRVNGPYRVKNVTVLDKETGAYVPLNPEKAYVIASHNYLLVDHGSGASMFDHIKILSDDGLLETEMLETYLTDHLNGVIGEEYAAAQGRIHITDGSLSTESVIHTVESGDTLWDLSRKYQCEYEELLKRNHWISDPDLILVGWRLDIPA